MFQFTGFASHPYGFRMRYPLMRVGCPIRKSSDITPVYRLPEAYRRLLRPSSPAIAKASTMRINSLDSIVTRARLATATKTPAGQKIRKGKAAAIACADISGGGGWRQKNATRHGVCMMIHTTLGCCFRILLKVAVACAGSSPRRQTDSSIIP